MVVSCCCPTHKHTGHDGSSTCVVRGEADGKQAGLMCMFRGPSPQHTNNTTCFSGEERKEVPEGHLTTQSTRQEFDLLAT